MRAHGIHSLHVDRTEIRELAPEDERWCVEHEKDVKQAVEDLPVRSFSDVLLVAGIWCLGVYVLYSLIQIGRTFFQ